MPSITDSVRPEAALEYLNKIIEIQTRLAAADFNVNAFMGLVVEQVQMLTPATGVVVELVEADDMVYRAASGTIKKNLGLKLSRQNSISGLCVKEEKVLISNDTEIDDRVNLPACRQVGARSLVVAPLLHNGNAIGVIKILSYLPNAFNGKDIQILEMMAQLIASALAHQIDHAETTRLLHDKSNALNELEEAKEQLERMANFDFLTGLPNRLQLIDKMSLAIEENYRSNILTAVMFLDIDGFKKVNDTYGHAIGDELLKAFAARVKNCIRKGDLLARLGGDEFVILLDGIPGPQTAIGVAEKIIVAMQEKFRLENVIASVSTSVGIAFAQPSATPDCPSLLKQADQALYEAKNAGKNQFKIFSQ